MPQEAYLPQTELHHYSPETALRLKLLAVSMVALLAILEALQTKTEAHLAARMMAVALEVYVKEAILRA
tara:strand:+ start:98 stop:304 length:207 start_codon:yes stop_codon:yes gene_type:complete